ELSCRLVEAQPAGFSRCGRGHRSSVGNLGTWGAIQQLSIDSQREKGCLALSLEANIEPQHLTVRPRDQGRTEVGLQQLQDRVHAVRLALVWEVEERFEVAKETAGKHSHIHVRRSHTPIEEA